ncbi:hypothetical protein OS188_08520 [Xanthomarina sp. F1114]|uniref:hypothetical protein n=1 Tax=Xanthomarina sp. F1114 TaxID=2996019 RepID=UPI00225DE4D9|nr:hypothetical protein [Xanthomarina sp. F1114]MCX7547996.1 hypothetical protein [Xanthomarina sp. F1114]
MQKLSFLLAFICVGLAFLSCDGRDRVYKSNSEVLKENKLLDSFSENISYIPETYSEVITDTILNNGFHIKIKTFSHMEQNVLKEFRQDSINYKEYYREFVSEVVITKNSEEIFNKTIDKQFFNAFKNNLKLNNSIIKLIFDQTISYKANTVVLSVMIEKIDSKKIRFCDLIIDSEGNFKLKEVKELYAYIN